VARKTERGYSTHKFAQKNEMRGEEVAEGTRRQDQSGGWDEEGGKHQRLIRIASGARERSSVVP